MRKISSSLSIIDEPGSNDVPNSNGQDHTASQATCHRKLIDSDSSFDIYFQRHYPKLAENFICLPKNLQDKSVLLCSPGTYWTENVPRSNKLSEEDRLKQCWAITVHFTLKYKFELEARMKSRFKLSRPRYRDIQQRTETRFWERSPWDEYWCGTHEGCWWLTTQDHRPNDACLDTALNAYERRYFKAQLAVKKLRDDLYRAFCLAVGIVAEPLWECYEATAFQEGSKTWNFIKNTMKVGPKLIKRQFYTSIRAAWRRRRHHGLDDEYRRWCWSLTSGLSLPGRRPERPRSSCAHQEGCPYGTVKVSC